MKLTEKEKQYSWKDWLEVAWLAVRHPIRFVEYLAWRSWVQREQSKTHEERAADARKYVDALKEQTK